MRYAITNEKFVGAFSSNITDERIFATAKTNLQLPIFVILTRRTPQDARDVCGVLIAAMLLLQFV